MILLSFYGRHYLMYQLLPGLLLPGFLFCNDTTLAGADEDGNPNAELSFSKGQIVFTETENGTRVEFKKMIYSTETGLQKIVEMGCEQGI